MTNDKQTDGLTWVSAQRLIQLRQHARQLPLTSGKIHARQGGAYLSSFKGRGMEFDESRIYLAGDDIRSMDWKVTARSGEPHTKVFREERERPVLLWLDLNASMFFATRGAFKSVVAASAAGLLAWSASAHNDRLGALVFAGNDHVELKPRRGKSSVLDFIRCCCSHAAWDLPHKTAAARSMENSMSRLRKVAKPGSLVFMLSDFREMNEQAISHLASIARHNDVVLLHIFDPLEAGLPAPGYYRVSDGINEVAFNTSNKQLRDDYASRFAQHEQALQKLCRQHRMHMISISTSDDILATLQKGLGIRIGNKAQYRAP